MIVQDRMMIEALDTIDEVARVVTSISVTVAARALDEYESSGVTAVLEWSTQRLRESLVVLGRDTGSQGQGAQLVK